jgi:Beta-glucosidase (SUN family)
LLTASSYYINPPGTGAEGCIWGDASKPVGNWAPYVAGGNTVAGGMTFLKIGYNPIWTGCSLSNTKPTFGVRITCDGGGCNGLPCEIDPSKNPIGAVTSPDAAVGAGDAAFCVVTVPSGGKANIEVFDLSGKGASPTSATSSSSSAHSSTTSSSSPSSSSSAGSLSTESSSASSTSTATHNAGVFFENSTSTTLTDFTSTGATATGSKTAVTTSSKTGEAVPRQQGNAAIVGLLIAFVVAACLY